MTRHLTAGFAIIVTFGLFSCERDETKQPGYQAGYAAGVEDGKADERANMCSRIENFSDSIHSALEGEGICG